MTNEWQNATNGRDMDTVRSSLQARKHRIGPPKAEAKPIRRYGVVRTISRLFAHFRGQKKKNRYRVPKNKLTAK